MDGEICRTEEGAAVGVSPRSCRLGNADDVHLSLVSEGTEVKANLSREAWHFPYVVRKAATYLSESTNYLKLHSRQETTSRCLPAIKRQARTTIRSRLEVLCFPMSSKGHMKTGNKCSNYLSSRIRSVYAPLPGSTHIRGTASTRSVLRYRRQSPSRHVRRSVSLNLFTSISPSRSPPSAKAVG